jgi:hypothetical protein
MESRRRRRHRHRRPAFASTWLLAALTAGCSDVPSAEEAIDDSLALSCEQAFECRSSFPTGTGVTFEEIYGTSVEACLPRLAALFGRDAVVAAVDAGTIAYDGGDALTCLEAAGDLTCAEVWSEDDDDAPPECETAFVGLVPSGGACEIAMECADENAYCDPETATCVVVAPARHGHPASNAAGGEARAVF